MDLSGYRELFAVAVKSRQNPLARLSRLVQTTAVLTSKNARLVLVFAIGFACAGINAALIISRHYRAPAFVFVAAFVLVWLVLKKVPQPSLNQSEMRGRRQKAYRSSRRLGFLFAASYAVALLELFTGQWKDIPALGVIAALLWGAFLIFWCFYSAARIKRKMQEDGAAMTVR